MVTLYTISYSPWSEKARWALDASHIAYREAVFVPMLGEPGLRLRSRRWRGRMSAPFLLDGDDSVVDSFAIARWAARRSKTCSLLPPEHMNAIVAWNTRSERFLEAVRILVTRAVAANDEAASELVPRPLNRLGPLTRLLAKTGSRYLRWKYHFTLEHAGAARDLIRRECLHLRHHLNGRESPLVGGAFSFADIAMAAALQGVTPVSQRHWPLGDRTRRCWRPDKDLAEDFVDLAGWRDGIYEAYRR